MFSRVDFSATQFGEVVDKNDVVRDWCFRQKDRVLFVDGRLEAFGDGFVGAEKLKKGGHRLVAVLVCWVIFKKVLSVVG